jgi:hypothetical protein
MTKKRLHNLAAKLWCVYGDVWGRVGLRPQDFDSQIMRPALDAWHAVAKLAVQKLNCPRCKHLGERQPKKRGRKSVRRRARSRPKLIACKLNARGKWECSK